MENRNKEKEVPFNERCKKCRDETTRPERINDGIVIENVCSKCGYKEIVGIGN